MDPTSFCGQNCRRRCGQRRFSCCSATLRAPPLTRTTRRRSSISSTALTVQVWVWTLAGNTGAPSAPLRAPSSAQSSKARDRLINDAAACLRRCCLSAALLPVCGAAVSLWCSLWPLRLSRCCLRFALTPLCAAGWGSQSDPCDDRWFGILIHEKDKWAVGCTGEQGGADRRVMSNTAVSGSLSLTACRRVWLAASSPALSAFHRLALCCLSRRLTLCRVPCVRPRLTGCLTVRLAHFFTASHCI